MAKPIESVIETYLKKQIKQAGGLAFKFKSTINAVPDQLVIHDGTMHLIEVKRPDAKPRANQVDLHNTIEQHGVPVHVIDTKEGVDTFIQNELGVAPATPKRYQPKVKPLKT